MGRKLSFRITDEDYWNFTKASTVLIPDYRLNTILNFGLLCAVVLGTNYFFPSQIYWVNIACVVFAILSGSLLLFLLSKQRTKEIARQMGVLGYYVLEVDQEVIIETTSFCTIRRDWRGIKRIENTKDYILLFNNHYLAHIIPKRAFATNVEAAEFLLLVREYWQESKSKASIIMKPSEFLCPSCNSTVNSVLGLEDVSRWCTNCGWKEKSAS